MEGSPLIDVNHSDWTLSPDYQETMPRKQTLLQIRGTSPEENICLWTILPTILPSRIISIDASKEPDYMPGEERSPAGERFMRSLKEDCKNWTYAYYDETPRIESLDMHHEMESAGCRTRNPTANI
jgi:hypothetical protein